MTKAKLLVLLCILSTMKISGQVNFNTNGLFEFVDSLRIPSGYMIAPGQVSKNGDHFMLGLTSGNLEDLTDLNSNLYSVSIGSGKMESLNLPNQIDLYRFYQCTASANDAVIVMVVNEGGGWADNELGIAYRDSAGNYPNMFYLSNINDEVVSDAYPWISADAKDLYFSRDFTLMYTHRENVKGEFNDPVKVDFEGDVNLEIISAWLTPDQLKMYFIANNLIYLSERKKITDPFSFPQIFTSEFKNYYFIAGLSFMPDKKTMFIYYSDEQTEKILQYHLKKGKI